MTRVALVHDWLIHMRGGEKVLEALAEIYPDATIYTLFYDRSKLSPFLQKRKIKASFLNSLPGIKHYYRWLLPLMPMAIRSLKIENADLVISSSHCVAKGIEVPENAFHICYCHTPMRYLWGFEEVYFKSYFAPVRWLIQGISSGLRNWDIQSNSTVNEFISNSDNVRKRIQQYYGRDARVIYPPLDAAHYQPAGKAPQDYYLVVSHFVPYKRLDIVIKAFNELDRQLLVVGSGPMEKEYRKIRRSEKISFLGSISDAKLKQLYSEAKALIFPAEEDFGIVPLEAQSCGAPVIAFGKGGSLESVKTGIFFDQQTPAAVRQAVLEFEKKPFNRNLISKKVQDFDRGFFKERVRNFVNEVSSRKINYAAH